MTLVLIKGSQEEAIKAANDHGITLSKTFEVRRGESAGHTVEDNMDEIMKWFSETADKVIVEGIGFPAGTLLWYRTKD